LDVYRGILFSKYVSAGKNDSALTVPKISSQELRLIHTMIRKTSHVIEYFVLGLLLFRAFLVVLLPPGSIGDLYLP